MPTIKSLEDLKKIREEALKKRGLKATSGAIQLVVGMGTPGIATGARETLKEILKVIEDRHIGNVIVRQTGGSGLDSWEPVVRVIKGEEPAVTYGKVTPSIAIRILEEHVLDGRVVREYVIPA